MKPNDVNTPSDNNYFEVVMGRLKEALNMQSDTALAAALGMSQSAFANRKKGGSVPFQNVISLALKQGVDLAWLFGDVERAAQLSEMSPEALDELRDKLGVASEGKKPATQMRRLYAIEASPERFSEFDLVERKGILGSAGPGAENVFVEPKGALAFRRDWLRAKGVRASQLIVADIVGDSMEPTLFHGDTVVFDAAHVNVSADDIYLFSLEGRLYVKRLRHKPGHVIEVISDNRERYPPFEITEKQAEADNFDVRGRFFWRGGDRLQ
jgi:phage repressor protein C with HTH and peptisase S24 domain